MKLTLALFIALFFWSDLAKGQCCSAGSGSPLAGGTSQGVLGEGQAEINFNQQLISTRKFLTGDSPARDFLHHYGSNYSYLRLGYGISKELTLSVETGYYQWREQVALSKKSIRSSGVSDLIIFPRYQVYNSKSAGKNTEVTLGLGYKFPLGRNDVDVTEVEPFSGESFSYKAPPAIQLTTGSQDIFLVPVASRS